MTRAAYFVLGAFAVIAVVLLWITLRTRSSRP